MSDNIIERAAKAITPEWDRASASTKRNARLTAAAVLEAARDPTEAMVKAVQAYFADDHGNEGSEGLARGVIDDVFAVALTDKPV